ncbi:trypsin-like serine peptidase, partial [Methylobacterium trifolii]|uniref:trypsin-like serine peptidase n=1 Tax=Methylobacterium trifolii TaxID=1003092 RepID=UPI001EE14761
VDLRLQAAATTAIFDFDSDGSQTVSIQASELLAWDPVLDYAVLRIPDDCGRPPLRLAKDPLQAAPGQYVPVNIVQHPAGRPKQFAIRNNLVREVKGDEVQYFTDTRSGSSGSPVLDDFWRVVALHKASRSVSGVNFQGRTTAYVNVGTTIMAIRHHIQGLHADLWDEIEPRGA